MKKVRISLIDNDFVLRAKAELTGDAGYAALIKLLQCFDQEFVPGEAAHLEIEGLKDYPVTLEISHNDQTPLEIKATNVI